jgi:hypothetical protein
MWVDNIRTHPDRAIDESLAHEVIHGLLRTEADTVTLLALEQRLYPLIQKAQAGLLNLRHKLTQSEEVRASLRLKQSERIAEEFVTAGLTDAKFAKLLHLIPGTRKGKAGSIWDEFKDIIVEKVSKDAGIKDKTLLDDLHAVLDTYVGGKADSVYDTYKLTKVSPGTVTLEATGLKQIFDTISDGVRRSRGLFEKVKRKDFDPTRQADQVQDEVLEVLRGEYQRITPKESVEATIRKKARDQGWELRKTKSGFNLTREGRKVSLKSLDEVSDSLGYGKSAKKYRDELYEYELDLAGTEGLASFERKYFPDGIEDATPKQWDKAVTRLKKNISENKVDRFGDRWLKQVRTVFGRTPAGEDFWKLIRKTEDEGMIAFADDLFGVEGKLSKFGGSKWKKSDQFLEDVRLYLDGYGVERRTKKGGLTPPSVDNPQAKAAADAIRPVLDEVYNAAKKAGIKVASFRKDYFPRAIPKIEALKAGAKRKEILAATVREGRFKTLEDATDKLDGFISRVEGNRSDNRFIEWLAKEKGITFARAEEFFEQTVMPKYIQTTGNLTKQRIADIPWYDRNLLTGLSDYLMDARRSIVQHTNYGKGKQIADRMIDKIRVEGGNYELAMDTLERLTNPYSRKFKGPNSWQRKALTFQSITKLNPLTTIVNMSQNFATALRTSPSATLKAVAGYDKEFAQRSAAIVNQTIKDVMLAHGAASPLGTKYMKWIGFTKSEQILRTIASNAGKHHAMDLGNLLTSGKRVKYARRQLRSLGLDPDVITRRGRLSDQELLQAGKRVSDETQFRGNVIDLPEQWLTGHGRILTQFKTFVYNQAHLLKRSVVDEAKAGNLRPLAFLMSVYPIAGAGYDLLVNQILLGQESPDSLPEWYWRGISSVGGLGIMQTALESVAYGEKAVLSALLGPTLSDAARATQAYKLFTGENYPVAKELLGRAPFMGRIFRNRMFEKRGKKRRRRRRRRSR